MTAVSQVRQRRRDMEIVALEKSDWLSYSSCGIPYYVADEVAELDDLVARTPQEFRDQQLVDVRMRHEARAIDLDRRHVEVRDHVHGRTIRLGFDHLLIGTGARPARPDLPGIGLDFVHGVQSLDDAKALHDHAERVRCQNVVVVGSGYIGLEMADTFLRRGAQVAVVESNPQVMRTLDADMGALIADAMRDRGIDIHCDTEVEGFEPGVVHTSGGPLPADLVILGLGVEPNSEIAADAGVPVGSRKAIRVTPRQQTLVEGVWAAGDCAESFDIVSRRWLHIALGTVANRQSRVAGINIGGGDSVFPGVVGTAVTKLCATEVARTGLTEFEAKRSDLPYAAVKIESTTRAGYLKDTKPITVKMLAAKPTGRVLGAQIVGEEGAAKRIDVVATAISARMTVHQMIDLDLSYAPPFSPLWDPVIVAARQAAKAVNKAR
jgi:NADPH-dependent 2,4-dienoyl-CoA reductase/sulfur reductase-like enzyme